MGHQSPKGGDSGSRRDSLGSQYEPTRAEPSRVMQAWPSCEPAATSRAEPGPSRATPSRAEPRRAEPRRAEMSQDEPRRARAKPSRAQHKFGAGTGVGPKVGVLNQRGRQKQFWCRCRGGPPGAAPKFKGEAPKSTLGFVREPKRAKPSWPEPSRAEPGGAESSRGELRQAKPRQAEPETSQSQAEPAPDESRVWPDRAAASPTDPSRAELSRDKTEPSPNMNCR